jgi:hypothetical protein
MKPSWRKPFGMILLIMLIIIWSIIVINFSGQIGQLPGILQFIIYAVCGIIWIAPLKPFLAWMEKNEPE